MLFHEDHLKGRLTPLAHTTLNSSLPEELKREERKLKVKRALSETGFL